MPTEPAISLEAFISDVPRLSSFAGVVGKLESVMRDSSSSLQEVAEMVGQDQSLTARLLRLANSSFYGFPNRLETIQEAVTLLGLQQIQDLVWASTVIRIFAGVPSEFVTMAEFWKHSIACGIASRTLALSLDVARPEKFFVCGLLHDIGRMVIYTKQLNKTREIFLLQKNERLLLRQAEEKTLGFDHAQIGESLLKQWNFPPNLVNAVRWHHHPMASDGFQLDASIVHVADYLMHAFGFGTSGERFIPPLDKRACERIDLSLQTLEQIMDEVRSQVYAVEKAFLHSH